MLYAAATRALSQVQECDDDGDVRLVNGANSMEGRVQVCIREIWRRVCGFLGRDEEDVVCKQMGYLRGGEGIVITNIVLVTIWYCVSSRATRINRVWCRNKWSTHTYKCWLYYWI